MADEFAIKVDHVSKSFRLPHDKQTSIKGAIINFRKRTFERQQVLNDIDFEIKKGEFFGIVGRNGSGKSTLLKLLAGIYAPDEGQVHIRGKLTPFIELGVGFNPELTGRENVYLNGALLGFNRKEVDSMYDEIVEFAELGRFMDQKLKNYSSGMQVRLAFSVATRAKSDILLIDEVLAVGDQSFQEKCFEYFAQIKKSGRTVVFVTHDMSNVERFCDRVFVIDRKSEVNGMYAIPDAVALYNQLNHENLGGLSENLGNNPEAEVLIRGVELLNDDGHPVEAVYSGEPLNVKVNFEQQAKGAPLSLVIGLAFHDSDGNNLAGPNSKSTAIKSSQKSATFRIDKIPFNMGEYAITVALFNKDATKQYDLSDKRVRLFVNTHETHHGRLILDGSWRI